MLLYYLIKCVMQCNGFTGVGRLERTFIPALSVWRPGKAAKTNSFRCVSLLLLPWLCSFMPCLDSNTGALSPNIPQLHNILRWWETTLDKHREHSCVLQVQAARGRPADTGRDANIYQVKILMEIALHCQYCDSFVLRNYYLSLLVHTHPDS